MLPSWVHYTTSCNTQSSAPVDGQNNFPKHVELTGIINKLLLLILVGCLHYLYQWCTVKQILDNEIYLLIKYIKSVLWRAAKRLSYIEDARCLKVNRKVMSSDFWTVGEMTHDKELYLEASDRASTWSTSAASDRRSEANYDSLGTQSESRDSKSWPPE